MGLNLLEDGSIILLGDGSKSFGGWEHSFIGGGAKSFGGWEHSFIGGRV